MGCDDVMIQLLVSLIEWFAVMGLSVLGIAYEPPQPCFAPEPTEFRQAVVWTPSDTYELSGFPAVAGGDCFAGSDALIHSTKPYFVTPSDRYDS